MLRRWLPKFKSHRIKKFTFSVKNKVYDPGRIDTNNYSEIKYLVNMTAYCHSSQEDLTKSSNGKDECVDSNNLCRST